MQISYLIFVYNVIIDFLFFLLSNSGQKVTQDTALEKLLTVMEENKKERKKVHNEAVERQDRMLNILKIPNKYLSLIASSSLVLFQNIYQKEYTPDTLKTWPNVLGHLKKVSKSGKNRTSGHP